MEFEEISVLKCPIQSNEPSMKWMKSETIELEEMLKVEYYTHMIKHYTN